MFRHTFKKLTGAGIAVASLGLLPGTALAGVGGCVNSPENATLTLVLLGAAAAGLPKFVKWRNARRRRI